MNDDHNDAPVIGGFAFRDMKAEFLCPCGKRAKVGRASDGWYAGGSFGDSPVILHELPPCEDLKKRSFSEYLVWARGAG